MKTTLDDYILTALPRYFHEKQGQLSHPYVSPGAQYAADLWDWDSYWMIFATLEAAKQNKNQALKEMIAPYALGTLLNFLEHQGEDGCIPILICKDDDDPFDCRINPENNMAKPFFGQLAGLLQRHDLLPVSELSGILSRLQKFHDCLDKRYLHEGTGLIRWGKDWGIGVDDDPTAWGRPPLSSANIFLNSIYLKDCQSMLDLAEAAGDMSCKKMYQTRIERLKNAIETCCWDNREKAYFTLDVQCHQRLTPHRKWKMLNVGLQPCWQGIKLKVLSWSSMLPFWLGLGTQEQFAAFVNENLIPERLWSDHGVRALSKDEPMYAPEIPRGNPSNWLGPIWIVANYIVWETLKTRGYVAQAEELAKHVRGMLQRDLDVNGCLHEYYSPESGKGIMGDGFMSWNCLAVLMK